MSDMSQSRLDKEPEVHPVSVDVIIPTLANRESLLGVIDQLEFLTKDEPGLDLRVIVSFNPKPPNVQTIFIDENRKYRPNFSVTAIHPGSYQPTSEHHLLWCFDWYKANADRQAYIWPMTDNDPLIGRGVHAIIEFLRSQKADLLYVNNLWGDILGEPIQVPAFPVNALIWHGDASLFFRSLGFEHATSNIGGFLLRSSFLTPAILDIFRSTMARSEVCAHAWWMFEAGTKSSNFYFISTPALINKFNKHHFDDAPTWSESALKAQIPTKYSWTVGFLKHFVYYTDEKILSFQDIRTSMISEPQRGILPFLDDIIRRLFDQAILALRYEHERFDAAGIQTIKYVFSNVYPLRMPMINNLCIVLDRSITDARSRLLGYKLATKFAAVEHSYGNFGVIFVNASHGYYIYEHNLGFVAVLRKFEVFRAFRELDPEDVSPFILYAPTEQLLRDKIDHARDQIEPDKRLDNFDYFTVVLRPEVFPILSFPKAQLFLLSLSEKSRVRMLRLAKIFAMLYRRLKI